ncbi:hypothetical protein EAH89_25500 [Roseomonas nepalensis]|uniref:Uncharacterized protein n=1 Tax=Muricoccus nepalensis TaxID=1854500 RepID=A0A502F9H7_9PROT|nr:hypothetical protein [Roseomonas nepalensis]TPG45981.1 hypothetical protein EAH89_25500 [Roseomonas nepalensis]
MTDKTPTMTLEEAAAFIAADADAYYADGPTNGAEACDDAKEFAEYWLDGVAGELVEKLAREHELDEDELSDATKAALRDVYDSDRHGPRMTLEEAAAFIVAEVDAEYADGPPDDAEDCADAEEFADHWLEGSAGELVEELACKNDLDEDELSAATKAALLEIYDRDRHGLPMTLEEAAAVIAAQVDAGYEDGPTEDAEACDDAEEFADYHLEGSAGQLVEKLARENGLNEDELSDATEVALRDIYDTDRHGPR